MVISRDIDLHYGFLERVGNAFLYWCSRCGGDGPLALNQQTDNYKNCRFISRRWHGCLSVSCQCRLFPGTVRWLCVCVCVCALISVIIHNNDTLHIKSLHRRGQTKE